MVDSLCQNVCNFKPYQRYTIVNPSSMILKNDYMPVAYTEKIPRKVSEKNREVMSLTIVFRKFPSL